MQWNRRSFLGAIFGSGVFYSAASLARSLNADRFFAGGQSPKVGFSILQGMTDESSAQFSAVLPKGAYTVEISDGAIRLPSQVLVVERAFSDFTVHKVNVQGLSLGIVYTLRVRDAQGGTVDERVFRALDLSDRRVKLGLVSCQLDLLHHDDIWNEVAARKVDMLFFLGDNVYCDRTSLVRKVPADPKQLWERYVLSRNRVAFYFAKELVPVLATWDDHDFGTDNGDQTYTYKSESAEIFAAFFAQEVRPSLVAGPGIARRFSAFGADFYLLDGRTFRSPAGVADGRMFGADQDTWLYGSLADKPMLFINGSLFFGAYQKGESFEGQFSANFSEFLERLKAASGPCAFVSGDVHYSEIMDVEAAHLGYPSFEIVSSSIHSLTFPGHERRFNNPRRRSGIATGGHNFVVFEGEFSAGQIRGDVTSYSATKVEFTTPVFCDKFSS